MVTEKEYLFSYYNKEAKSFFKSIKQLGKDFDGDELHKLRISIKRIRTVYRLLEEFSGGRFHAQKHYSFFKKTFNIAGKIRELQINKLLITENVNSSGSLKLYLEDLDNKKKRYSTLFIKKLSRIDIPELKRETKKIKRRCKKISNAYFLSNANKLLDCETEIIKQLQDTSHKNVNTHKIRKHLKIFYSLVKLSHSIKPLVELKKLGIAIKETEELLGMWHDRIVLLRSFKKLKQKDIGQAEFMKKLAIKMGKQTELLLRSSISKIELIFKSLPKQIVDSYFLSSLQPQMTP